MAGFVGGNSAYLGLPLLPSLIPARLAQLTALFALLVLVPLWPSINFGRIYGGKPWLATSSAGGSGAWWWARCRTRRRWWRS